MAWYQYEQEPQGARKLSRAELVGQFMGRMATAIVVLGILYAVFH